MCSGQLTPLQLSLLRQKEQVAVSNSATHPKPATQLHTRGHRGPCQLGTTVKGHPICSTNVKEVVPPVEGLRGQ